MNSTVKCIYNYPNSTLGPLIESQLMHAWQMCKHWWMCYPFKASAYKEFDISNYSYSSSSLSWIHFFLFFTCTTHFCLPCHFERYFIYDTNAFVILFMRVIITAILSILCQTALTGANVIDKRSSFTLSPTVQNPSPEYVKLLNHSIMFFEAQRSGKLPDDNRISW